MQDMQASWHLDKKVPISIIIMFIVQTVTLVYVGTSWKTDIDSRIKQLEKSEDKSSSYENRIVILEQQFGFIRSDLAEIKELLRREIPRQP